MEMNYISIIEAEKRTNINQQTIRRYIKDFKDYIDIKNTETNRFFVNENTVDIIKIIRKCYEDGMNKIDIISKLEDKGYRKKTIIDITPKNIQDNLPEKIEIFLEVISSQKTQIDDLTKRVSELEDQMKRKENKSFLKRIFG